MYLTSYQYAHLLQRANTTSRKGIMSHCKAIAPIHSMAQAVSEDSVGHRWLFSHQIAK